MAVSKSNGCIPYAVALTWLEGKLFVEPANPNAYWAADAGTLATWLKAGQRVTCPGGNDELIMRVKEKMSDETNS